MERSVHSDRLNIAASQYKREREYWLKRLSGEIRRVSFQSAAPGRLPAHDDAGEKRTSKLSFRLDEQDLSALYAMAGNSDVRLHMILVALTVILLYKYTGERDILLGVPIYRQSVQGEYINTVLPLRHWVEGTMTVKDLLLRIKDILREASDHQSYPLSVLLKELGLTPSSEYFPLFDVAVLLENIHDLDYIDHLGINFILSFRREARILQGCLVYNPAVCDERQARRVAAHLVHLGRRVTVDTAVKIACLELPEKEEKQRLIYQLNRTEYAYSTRETMPGLFEKQAVSTPHRVAVSLRDLSVSYDFLNRLADQMSVLLVRKGVRPRSIVGLLLDRSLELFIALWGVWKAGGVYLPMDPVFPQQRLKWILADSDMRFLVASEVSGIHMDFAGTLLTVPWNELDAGESGVSNHRRSPLDPAYVIYTSGTTGRPKGVMILQKGVVNYGLWSVGRYMNDNRRLFALHTSISYDLTVTSMVTPLIAGGGVVVYSQEGRGFPLERVMGENRVDIVKLTPSHLKLLENIEPIARRIKCFIVGGEQLERQLAENIRRKYPEADIINEYGPTEATVGCIVYQYDSRVDIGFAVPIGGPVHNSQVYLLDEGGCPVPSGPAGEICISGDGLSPGYINDPLTSAEKFIENPYIPGKRMYRTGDSAWWREDDTIEYIGRKDRQVKIRGYRIEPGEIEHHIMHFNEIAARTPIREDEVRAFLDRQQELRICSRCLLPDSFPGIAFADDGVCNICGEFDRYAEHLDHYFKKPEDFMEVMKENRKRKRGEYDCLLLFSGGKDSTYVLYRLMEMGFKVLTFTLDNGYISETALQNIDRITSALGVENVRVKPSRMDRIFLESLKFNDNVCHGCWNVLNAVGLDVAYNRGINVIISGLSRGQIFDMRLMGLFRMGVFDEEEIEKRLLDFRMSFHSDQNRYAAILDLTFGKEVLRDIFFLDFFRYEQKTTAEIKNYLSRTEWKRPGDTGFCSSNCRINDAGILVHSLYRGYHFYAPPLSWECRMGMLSREEGLMELEPSFDVENIDRILRQVGYYRSPTVRDAVVTAKKDSAGFDSLSAYIAADEDFPVSDLRDYLVTELPDYMIPSYIVRLDALPVGPGGKVDLQALPAAEKNSDQNVAYEPPGNEAERLMAEIWETVLGRKRIGIRENFFMLGGDSLKSIQIVSRLKGLGYSIETNDIFQNPTMAELALRLNRPAKQVDQSPVTGEIPMIPVQLDFFVKNPADPHYFNQSVILFSSELLARDIVEAVFSRIQEHHDALRMTYRIEKGRTIQFNCGLPHPVSLAEFDLRGRDDDIAELERQAAILQGGIDLREGPLMKLGLFHLNDGDRLLIVIHHLVIDGVSWRILFEDIEILYRQGVKGDTLALPLKTDSFKAWSEGLTAFSQHEDVLREIPFWKEQEMRVDGVNIRFPRDLECDDNLEKDVRIRSFQLEEFRTGQILTGANEIFGTDVTDLLLTGLGLALKELFGLGVQVFALERHGREALPADLDVSRTVGWFTSVHPVVLDFSYESDLSRQILEVKESIRRVPNRGIGYGVLRYLTPAEMRKDLNFNYEPQVCFNYLGQFDADVERMSSFGIAAESGGPVRSPEAERRYEFDISGMVAAERLTMSVFYNHRHYRAETIERFVKLYEKHMAEILNFCRNRTEKEISPSDLGYKDLSIDEFKSFFD